MRLTENQQRIAVGIAIVVGGLTGYALLHYNNSSPCRKIRDLCEAKGFAPGRSPQQKRTFVESCFRPLLNGEAVGGTTITREDAEQCREFRRNNQAQRGEGAPSFDN